MSINNLTLESAIDAARSAEQLSLAILMLSQQPTGTADISALQDVLQDRLERLCVHLLVVQRQQEGGMGDAPMLSASAV